MPINEAVILAKAKAAMATAEKQALVKEKVDAYMTGSGVINGPCHVRPVPEAAAAFENALRNQVASHATGGDSMSVAAGGLGPTAVSALSKTGHSDVKVTNSGLEYEVSVGFEGDLHRESLYPEGYSGVDNIAALLNNGYGMTRDYVYGFWHGNFIHSLRERAGAHFVTDAISEFKRTLASTFGVKDISADNYK